MIITLEDSNRNEHYRKVQIETPSDEMEIGELLDTICDTLMAYGFHPSTVADGVISKAEEYEEDSDEEETDSEEQTT